ncbi:hypothetical protein V6E27_28700 [Bacillus cereus]|uniref:hypothetical protein n=1 Tax=Bacillus cereus TaxID=1396 RepID=UPI002FD9E6F1|nr:hypothetical protein [Bacillus cereus]MDA2454417.1 hypothetical protein [Bacillus cereus]
MEITVNETGFNEDRMRKGKVTIVTKANTFTIHTDYVDDAYYLASVLEDVAEEIEVKEN